MGVVLAVAIALSGCGGDDEGQRSGAAGDGGGAAGQAGEGVGGLDGAGGDGAAGDGTGGDGAGGDGGAVAARFALAVGPASGAVALRDSRRWLKIDLLRDAGFVEEVQVTLANPPPGVWGDSLTFDTELSTEGFQLELGPQVPLGDLTLAFTAISGAASATAELVLEVRPAQLTSPELIGAALLASSIDLGTSLLYRYYARFGDARLPEAFQGSGGHEDLMLPRDMEAATPELSVAELAALRPCVVRPDHPESVYAAPPLPRRGGALLRRPGAPLQRPAPAACDGGSAWRSERSPLVPVRVWIECGSSGAVSDSIETHSMSRVLRTFEKLWPTMTGLMGPPLLDLGGDNEGGDDAIDVYLVENGIARDQEVLDVYKLAHLGVNAYTAWSLPYATSSGGQGTSSAYLVLPKIGILSQKMRATMTHELFHALQFAHHDSANLAVDKTPYWFVEASATWSSVHFDRTLAWPARIGAEIHQGRFGRFQSEAKALNDSGAAHGYAAYIWPFFLEQHTGSPQVIRDIFEGLEGASSAAGADAVLDDYQSFAATFRSFALRNLNASFVPGDPLPKAERYVTRDDLFPDGAIQPSFFIASGDYTKSLDMPPLSASYFHLTLDDATAKRVELDFSGLQPQASLDVEALVETPDGWLSQPLSFTGEGKVVFCFDKGQTTDSVRGSFDSIELVLSNHAHAADAHVAGDLVITSSSAACNIWVGTTTATLQSVTAAGTLTQVTTSSAVLEFDAETAMTSSSAEIPYKLRGGTYQFDALFESSGRVPACRTIQTSSGPMHAGMFPDTSPGATVANLTLFTDSQPATHHGGGSSWATITETTNCNDSDTDQTSSGLGFLVWWQTNGILPLQPDGITASGSVDVPQGVGNDVHYDWLFTKQDE